MILCTVKNNTLSVKAATDRDPMVAAQFFFSPEWEDKTKIAVFKSGRFSKEIELEDDCVFKIDLALISGNWSASVYSPSTPLKTNTVNFKISASGSGTPYRGSWADKVYSMAQRAVEVAMGLRREADEGRFKGDKGDQGKAFTYNDFTPTQLAALKGDKGDQGIPGERGEAFTYSDFTPEQLEALKGERGFQGDKGDPFRYEDFTPAQLASLKGEKGDAFTYSDFTPEQLAALKGDKGDPGKDGTMSFEELTLEQKASLKGDKGDPFTYSDFTPEQLAALKGAKGDQGIPGIRGERGEDGYTPIKGVDYFDGKDGADGKDGSDADVTSANVIAALGYTPANERFSLSLIPTGTYVPERANINTIEYLKVGRFYCPANTVVATMTNCPTTEAFMMEVYSPLSTTVDDEATGQWRYRVRRLTTYTGHVFYQAVDSGATAGTFTYKAWWRIPEASTTGQIPTANIADSAVTSAKLAANAVSNYYTATTGASWSGTAAPYSIAVTVSGLTTSDHPIVWLNPSTTYSTAASQANAWRYIYRVAVTAANQLTLYSSVKSNIALPIQMVVVRK